ncbi:hypothetical protein [Marinicella sp. W31]|uniref:hypothetical protein n=1 Tax=Marinicella sp. W31 TaxID=3023713 RepID=UPI0037564B7C
MQPAFWLDVWEQPTQGFDQGCLNRSLELYIERLNLKPGETIFVPLCGRAYDMKWLMEQGFQVLGVELSEKAIRSFFELHDLTFKTRIEGSFTCFESENICIYQGDYFDLKAQDLSGVSAVYDRASLVAMPAEMRQDYVNHMRSQLPANTDYLLVSLEFDVEGGPPFSLTDALITDLYTPGSHFEKLGSKDLIELEPRFMDKGCSYFLEKAHLIRF